MRTTKIQIRDILGIREFNMNGESIELSGSNGVGKSSVLDAIRYALTNKSGRDVIVRRGAVEGEILIETDSGLSIDRKSRINRADYKSIKQNGSEIGSPEAFLKEIFTPLQLNPIEFMAMDKKQQNAIILDMIQYDWDMSTIWNSSAKENAKTRNNMGLTATSREIGGIFIPNFKKVRI